MKTKMIFIVCLFVTGFIFTSCQKDNDLVSDNSFGTVNEEQLAQDAVPQTGVFEEIKKERIFNYPNPFERITTIEYDLPKAAFVTIDVRNLREGYSFSLLHEYQEAGHHRLVFDSKNHPPGRYMVLLNARPYSTSLIITKKVIVDNGRFEPKR